MVAATLHTLACCLDVLVFRSFAKRLALPSRLARNGFGQRQVSCHSDKFSTLEFWSMPAIDVRMSERGISEFRGRI